MVILVTDFSLTKYRPHARGDGEGVLKIEETPMIPPARARGWGNVSLSHRLGRDSRAFKSSAYMSICVRDSTGSKQGVGMGQTGINANCGRRWMPV